MIRARIPVIKPRVAVFLVLAAVFGPRPLPARQSPPVRLTLRQAQDMAIKNHPRVRAAQYLAAAAGEQVREARSAYMPMLNADITGSQGNTAARIGAGSFSASRLFNREGQGLTFSQLITDMGRTGSLVSSSRLRQQAAQQDTQASRYDVLLAVTQAYYNALQAQAVVRVAEQTVAARRQLYEQIAALAENKLRSQLDVSYANVNLSDAKLMLIRAQDDLQRAGAELVRAILPELSRLAEAMQEEAMPTALAAPGASGPLDEAQARAAFRDAARLLYGSDWQRETARALSRDEAALACWLVGEGVAEAPPAQLLHEILALMRSRAKRIQEAADALAERISPAGSPTAH
jgi:outer membrane protein